MPGAPTGSTAKQPGPGAPPSPPPGAQRTPPKNPGMVTLTIDGKEVVAKPGTNMIEAAKQVGSEIPYYCYHPRLSIAANCRMCLVEVSPGPPKLQPACQTAIAEGQVVKTNTPRVEEQQRAVMEFLLLNHPVDCAICDQAGECKLQDYYMRYDHQPARLEGTKILRAKRKVLGPLVVLDQERCILCTRCVRFMSEVAKEPQLGAFGRGAHEYIDVFPGGQLDSNYSGNTVDICPVGALLNRDFRFRARAWFLSAAPSVCTGCSRGCSTFADFFAQDTYRYRPRENERINKSWMCDQGRLSYKYLNTGRPVRAYEGRGADRQEISREQALKKVAALLGPVAGKGGLAVLASPLASNEDLLATLTFAQETLGATEVYTGGRPYGQGDDFLMTADKNPNRRGLEWIARGLGLAIRPFDSLFEA
ncbi:MAG TPA: 2Fe-2S iron-sulfur cluster-binding protein, partial [Myxococcaceae bacterium]|nr:2Fe-2S iron-sulfur cluster-binding protein [Myxococcaceae bacterium]